MTVEELVGAINASGITKEQLTVALALVSPLVTRERLRAEEAAIRTAAAKATADAEAAAQAKHAEFVAAELALQGL